MRGTKTIQGLNMLIVISSKYEYLRATVRALALKFDSIGTLIYSARNQIRVVRLDNGLVLNIKRFRRPSFINRCIYSFIRPSKAQRAFMNARLFERLHIPTPEPIAYIENKTPLLQESYLITIHTPLQRNFYEFRYHPIAGYNDIISAFAAFMADVHSKDVLHLDLSPGNILFDKQKDDSICFSLVDINRIRIGKPISKKEACRNFCRLWGKQDFIERLAREYARCRGWDEQDTVHLISRYWRAFWHIRSQADIDLLFDPKVGQELITKPRIDLDKVGCYPLVRE